MRRPLRACTYLLVALMALAVCPVLAEDKEAEESEAPSPAAEFSELSVPLMGVTLGTMLLTGDQEDADAVRYCADAMVSAELAAELVKRVARRPRPCDPAAEDGFPSAHTTVAFAFAESLGDCHHDARPALYAFAATAAWARVEEGKHTWEQVLAGAALGLWIADRSRQMDGGLPHGAIAPRSHSRQAAFAPSPVSSGQGYTLWQTKW